MIRFVFLFLLILATPAFALNQRVEITSLPYTSSASRIQDTFHLMLDLSSNLGAINISNTNGCVFKGHGYTITFNTDGAKKINGVYFSGVNNNYLTVESLVVVQANAADSNNCIRFGGGRGNKVIDCSAHPKGMDTPGLRAYGLEMEIRGGNYTSYSRSFRSRMYYDASCLYLNSPNGTIYESGDSSWVWTYWVSHITIDSCPFTGINVDGGPYYIDSNVINIDATNDLYTYPSGTVDGGAGNAFAVRAGGSTSGCRIVGNTFTTGKNREGGRGIFLNGIADGIAADEDWWDGGWDFDISYNYIEVAEGPDDNYGEDYPVYGITLEGDHRNVNIHHNTIKVFVDNDSSTTWAAIDGMGIFLNFDNIVGLGISDSIHIYNNYIEIHADTNNWVNNRPEADVYGIAIIGYDAEWQDVWTKHNHIKSNTLGFKFVWAGGGTEGTSKNFRSYGDTIEIFTPSFTVGGGDYCRMPIKGAIGIGHYNATCSSHVFIDPVFIGDSGIYLASNGSSTINEITTKISGTIHVKNNAEEPIQNVEVTVWNAYDQIAINGITDASGNITDTFSIDYDRWVGQVKTDSVFNPFVIKVKSGDDSVLTDSVLSWSRKTLEIALDIGAFSPVLSPIGNKSVTEMVNLNFVVSASDNDTPTLTLSTSTRPSGATFTDHGNNTGTFDWTPNSIQNGTYYVTLYVTDGTYIDSEIVQIVVFDVPDDPPVLTSIGNKTVNEGQTLNFGVSASDPDGTTVTLYTSLRPGSASFIDNGNNTGMFNWTPTYNDADIYYVTFYASDGIYIDSEEVQITVYDTQPPSATYLRVLRDEEEPPPPPPAPDSALTIEHFPLDSSTSSTWNPLGIPRFQIAPLSDSGDIVVYSHKFPSTSTSLYYSKNLDSSTRWVSTIGGPLSDLDHAHVSVYNDTVYVGQQVENGNMMYVYDINGNSLRNIFTYTWPITWPQLYIMSVWRLPGSDTCIGISRGGDNESSILYWISQNKGVSWGSSQYIVNREGTGRCRIGMFYYDNTVAAIVDSGDYEIEVWKWDRATQSWTDMADLFNQSIYRTFGAVSMEDTTIFTFAATNTTGGDTLKSAYKHKGGSWTYLPKFPLEFQTSTLPPYAALTYSEALKTVVLFYVQCTDGTSNGYRLRMRYFNKARWEWSEEIDVSPSGHIYIWKCMTACIVPASHGNVVYVGYPSVKDGYNFGMITRVTIGKDLVDN